MSENRVAFCPECDAKLVRNSCKSCGWSAKPAEAELKYRCSQCDTPTRIVQLTPGDDGRDRCASCYVEYLRQRALKDPIGPNDFARCKAKLEDAYARAEAKWKSVRL